MNVIAHRGASADAPENTLQAFELAIEQGADMIETDLHLAADGSIPIWHDAHIQQQPIERLSLAEIRALAPLVPTLQETLESCGARIPFNLELKAAASGLYAGLEERVLRIVREMSRLDRVLFSSFEIPVLRRLRELEPKARIGVLRSSRFMRPSAIEEHARRLSAEAVNPAVRRLERAHVERLQTLGFRVNVYTVDEPAEQRRLIDWNVDGIFTNRPAQLRSIVDGN